MSRSTPTSHLAGPALHLRLLLGALMSVLRLLHNPAAMAQDSAAVAPPLAASGGAVDSTRINGTRLAIVTGAVAGTIAAIHIYQANGWWKENRRSFHFQEDLKYGLWVDKLGHFYGANAATFVLRRALEWTNMSRRQATLWGAAGSLLFQTYVEIEDGFSTWGFDRVDYAADVAGALYPVAQELVPPLQNFSMKFSYHPSPLIDASGGIGFQGQHHIMFDDYEGQTIWLSVRVHDLLPETVRPYWPPWLCLALGYGARDVALREPYPVYLLALDLDMTRILPQDTPLLQTIAEVLNFIHMPMPAVRISPGAIWYGVYF